MRKVIFCAMCLISYLLFSQEKGKATWYGKALHGNKTASGERFDMNAMTCGGR